MKKLVLRSKKSLAQDIVSSHLYKSDKDYIDKLSKKTDIPRIELLARIIDFAKDSIEII